MTTKAGRAVSQADKAAFMERLLNAWLEVPDIRFGQLIDCVLSQRLLTATKSYGESDDSHMLRDMFYLEDEDFVSAVEEFVRGSK